VSRQILVHSIGAANVDAANREPRSYMRAHDRGSINRVGEASSAMHMLSKAGGHSRQVRLHRIFKIVDMLILRQ
jgi:hypothetical protein